MKEGIGSRVKRIVSASVNGLVDAVENAAPEMVMEEAIREIEGATDEVRAEMGKVLARTHMVAKSLEEKNRTHAELNDKIGFAVEQNRDDLAQAGIAKQMDIEAQIPVLEEEAGDLAVQEEELEGYLNALQAKRREMKEALADFREAQQQAAAPSATETSTGGGKSTPADRVAKAESAFSRVMERQTGLETATSDTQTEAKLAELEELTRENRIKERLAAFKAGQPS